MKIARIVGQVFVNTVPAEVGTEVYYGDMIDARDATVELDNGKLFIGICTRLGDVYGTLVPSGVAPDTSTPTPTREEVVVAVETTSPAEVVTPVAKV